MSYAQRLVLYECGAGDRMSKQEDLIGKMVIATTGPGGAHAAGHVIGYCALPSFIIENADGVRFSWVASMCKPANDDCPSCQGRGYALPEPIGNFRYDLTAQPCEECASG